MPLPYLFVADYADGTRYEQGHDDVSIQRPDKNAYYDIHYQPFKPEGELIRFSLVSTEEHGTTYTVDLRDGHFEINDIPFRMWEGPVEGCRLVYFKRHTHAWTGSEIGHEVVYRIGWQALINGESVERVLEVD